MKTNQEIYDEIYGNSMRGIKQKIPQGWGLIKVQGQEPIINVPGGGRYSPSVNEEFELEKQQQAVWNSFLDDDDPRKFSGHDDISAADMVINKMPSDVRQEYQTKLLELMQQNKSVRDLNKQYGFAQDPESDDVIKNEKGQWMDSTSGEIIPQSEVPMYESERNKFMKELRRSIELGR